MTRELFTHHKLYVLKYFSILEQSRHIPKTGKFRRLVFCPFFFADLFLCYILSLQLDFNHPRQVPYCTILSNFSYQLTMNAARTVAP